MRLLSVILLILSFPLFAKEVNWVLVDYPPYYILQGEYKGQGRDESVVNLLKPHLSEYQHKYHEMPVSRAVKSVRSDDKVFCIASLYKTPERQQFIHFTENYATIGLAPAIAMRKSVATSLSLNEKKPVSLSELITQKGLTIGLPLNRSYGNVLDAVIELAPRHQVSYRAGADSLESLTYMLQKQRVDLILGYPSEHYYLKALMDKEDELTQISISETNQIVKGYLGCSKNKAGKAVIDKLDSALAKRNQSAEFEAIMLRWLPDNLKAYLAPMLIEQ